MVKLPAAAGHIFTVLYMYDCLHSLCSQLSHSFVTPLNSYAMDKHPTQGFMYPSVYCASGAVKGDTQREGSPCLIVRPSCVESGKYNAIH